MQAGEPGNSPRIMLNTYSGAIIEGEAFVADHVFSYILQGQHDVWLGDEKYAFREGDFRFFRRNQLTKYVKSTADGSFRSVSVHIDQFTLREMSDEYGLTTDERHPAIAPLLVQPDNLLQSFVSSLLPYLQQPVWDERILSLKTKELVLLLIRNNDAFRQALFDFSEPGKIDLEAFMNSHYRYNVPMDKFAFLSGRSLSGFKRDFEKLFHTSPGRWLLQRRLEAARFLIEERREKPSEVYLDLGFEDLSHFSFAYKKAFGHAPSRK